MKLYIKEIALSCLMCVSTSCVSDLLDQTPTSELSSDLFWKTTEDATSALHGVYNATRTFFHKEYAWDTASDIMWGDIRNPYNGTWQPSANVGSNNENYWKNAYQVINRANYVIENVDKMLNKYPEEKNQTELKRIKGELYFLRALAYFRLIDLWGDVPFYKHTLNGNNEAFSLPRTPRSEIKDSILKDLDFAKVNVPVKIADSQRGRATRVAMYGFSGKIKLYWASWMKNENKLEEANQYYKAAASDFEEVMKPEYGRMLYKNGDPGEPTEPFYAELFNGKNEYCEEIIFATSNAGPNSPELGDYYTYDFATRSTGAGGTNVTPTIRLVDKYQLLSTGEYATPMIKSDAANKETLENGACNPESYEGRDYRMYATVMWDGQKMVRVSDDGKTIGPDTLIFKYKFDDNVTHISAGRRTGYIFRKFVRTYAYGPRNQGPQDTYLMRLPDVWLMYCEAVNEYNNGPTNECFSLIDQIRRRGGLPALDRAKFGTKETFFNAIDQERCVELIAEGHRFFDIRRWNMVEKLWPQPDGYRLTSTWGELFRDEFRNAQDRDFQRFYRFKIPQLEIDKNPNMVQNECWL